MICLWVDFLQVNNLFCAFRNWANLHLPRPTGSAHRQSPLHPVRQSCHFMTPRGLRERMVGQRSLGHMCQYGGETRWDSQHSGSAVLWWPTCQDTYSLYPVCSRRFLAFRILDCLFSLLWDLCGADCSYHEPPPHHTSIAEGTSHVCGAPTCCIIPTTRGTGGPRSLKGRFPNYVRILLDDCGK